MVFKRLFRRRRRAHADLRQRQVYLTLFQLQRNRNLLEVRIPEIDQVYQSIILGLDPVRREVVIDELFPGDFVGLPGQALQLTVRLPEGKKLQFGSTIEQVRTEAEAPMYVIAMPRELGYDQRRAAYRLPFADHAALPAWITTAERRHCVGAVRDISSCGLRLALDGFETPPLEQDQICETSFEFGGMHLNCGLDVRNVDNRDENGGRTFIGGRFVDLPRTQQRMLDKLITRIQRDRLRDEMLVG